MIKKPRGVRGESRASLLVSAVPWGGVGRRIYMGAPWGNLVPSPVVLEVSPLLSREAKPSMNSIKFVGVVLGFFWV